MRSFKIFHDPESKFCIAGIAQGLHSELGLDPSMGGELLLPADAFNSARAQYDAALALSRLIKIHTPALWVVSQDLYCSGMNFVFGYALPRRGAVISISRLDSLELIVKEAIHEAGHILGLGHCSNPCVMQFSNSLWEAKLKPAKLCSSCRMKLAST